MTGPFEGFGTAATNYWNTTREMDAQARADADNKEQLRIANEDLKLRQQKAEQERIDKLANGQTAFFDFANLNSKYLKPEQTAAIGQYQADWNMAYTEYLTNGGKDTAPLLAFNEKYKGGQIEYTVNGERLIMSPIDVYREVSSTKPMRDFQDTLAVNMSTQTAALIAEVTNDPTASQDDRAAAAAAGAALGKPGTDPLATYTALGAALKTLSPERLMNKLVAGLPTDGKGWLEVKGMVAGLRTRYTDEESVKKLDAIEAMYDPTKATSPEGKVAAEKVAADIKLYTDSRDATLKAPVVELDGALLVNEGRGLDLNKAKQTFASTVALVNSTNNLGIDTNAYKSKQLQFAGQLLELENEEAKIGVMANIAKQGAMGRPFLENLLKNPDAMKAAGLTPAMVQSALDRAGTAQKAIDYGVVLSDATTIKNLQDLGYAGAAGFADLYKKGYITETDAKVYADVASLRGRAEEMGLNLSYNTASNQNTQQLVLGETVEELTRMGVNVERITLGANYMTNAYNKAALTAKIAAGLPGLEANAAAVEAQVRSIVGKNTITVETAKGPYLVSLTNEQMAAAVQMAKNAGIKASVDGTYVFDEATAQNILSITTANANIQVQRNNLAAATAIAGYVGSAAANEIFANIAKSKASTQEASNLLASLQAAAPYMGEAGMIAVSAQIATGQATYAEAVNNLQKAHILRQYLPQMIQTEVSSAIAQGRFTEAQAAMQKANLTFSDFGGGLNVAGALATVIPYDQAVKMPGFNDWLKRNGITADAYKALGVLAKQDASGQTASDRNSIRVGLKTTMDSDWKAYQDKLKSTEYLAWEKELLAFNLPKVDVDAFTGDAASATALEAGAGRYDGKVKELLTKMAQYRKTQVAPLYQAWQASKKKHDEYVASSAGSFEDGAGDGTGGTTGVSAPAPFQAKMAAAGKKAGVATNLLNGLFYAESTFGTNQGNYKGMDYVGPGQIGALAQQDVNAMLKARGLPPLDRNNPDQNIEIAAHYFAMKLKEFGGNAEAAYLAYNAGSAYARAHLNNNGGKINLDNLNEESRTGILNLRAGMGGFNNAKVDPTPSGPNKVPNQNVRKPGLIEGVVTAPTSKVSLTKLGISPSAIYNGQNADGSVISYCTRFGREITEKELGLKDRALSGSWFGADAVATQALFQAKGGLYLSNMTTRVAGANLKSIQRGDVIFLDYPKSDNRHGLAHVAIADGNGGIIQHSSPGFRGQTIEGAVNRMTLTEFLQKAGPNAVVSFGRVPSGGVPAPQRPAPGATGFNNPPAKTGAGSGSTPAKPAQNAAPKPAFKYTGDAFSDRDRLDLYNAVQAIYKAGKGQPFTIARNSLATLRAQLIKDGYKQADVDAYIKQVTK